MMARDERVLTLDNNPDQLFKAWQKAGKIPPQYSSWGELESTYMSLLNEGNTEKQAREAMGVTYRNVDGQPILQINKASDGSTRGLNKRAVRVDFNIGAENHLRNRKGQPAVDSRISELQTDWNKLSKLEAQQLGIETGKQFHRGHVIAGLEGGSLGNENMWPEHGLRNVLHGSAPRWPMSVIEDNAIPKDDLATIYERILQAEGLGMDRINNAIAIAMDEQMVQPTGPKTYIRDNEAGIAPEAGLAIQRKLNELEAQGVSRQAIENWSRDQSATLSRGNAVAQSGPVRQVRKPTSVPIRTKESGALRTTTRRVPQGGGPAVTNRTASRLAAPAKPARLPRTRPGKPPARPTNGSSRPKPAPRPSPIAKIQQMTRNIGAIDRATNSVLGEIPGVSAVRSMMRFAD